MSDYDKLVEQELKAHQSAIESGKQTESTIISNENDLPSDVIDRINLNKACLDFVEQVRLSLSNQPEHVTEDNEVLPFQIGRFLIQEQLGSGGFGIVYRALDEAVGREVAIKVPRPEILSSKRLLERFRREARAVAKLDHPNILRVYESDEEGFIPYIVMPYIDGGNLANWQSEIPTISPEVATEIVRQLAEGVAHAHNKGILHRDIKPINVLLNFTEDTAPSSILPFVPKLMDFGLAKIVDSDHEKTNTGAFLGTTNYMAPEQTKGQNQDVTALSDIFSLGVILYELLTGSHPFRDSNPVRSLDNIQNNDPPPLKNETYQIPVDLESICLKCLEKAPEKRYQSAHELADDLQRFLKGEPVSARPISQLKILHKWCRRHPVSASASIITSLALTTLIVISLGYNARLTTLLEMADTERATVREQAFTIRRRACWSDTRLAQIAWNQGDSVQAIALLSRHQPKENEEDVRHFAWWHLWNEYKQGAFILGRHKGGANAVTVTADGQLAASAGEDTLIRLWDLKTRTQIGELSGHEFDGVNSVEFSPSGAELVSGGDDGTLRFWDVNSQTELAHVRKHKSAILDVVYSPTSKLIASAGEDAVVRIWNAETKELVAELKGHSKAITALVFHPVERLLVSTSKDGTLRFWNLELFGPDSRIPNGVIQVPKDENWCRTLAFAPDGNSLVSSSIMSDIFHWSWELGNYGDLIARYEQTPNARSLHWSESGILFIGDTLCGLNQFHFFNHKLEKDSVWNVASQSGTIKAINGIAFNSATRSPLTASEDGTVRLWKKYSFGTEQFQTDKTIPKNLEMRHRINELKWSPDIMVVRNELCTVQGVSVERNNSPGQLNFISAVNGDLLHSFPILKEEEYAVSPQGNCILFCHRNGVIRCLETSELVTRWEMQLAPLTTTEYQRTHQTINQTEEYALLCWDKDLLLISMADGTVLKRMQHPEFVTDVIFDENANEYLKALTSCGDGGVRVWNLHSGKMTNELLSPEHSSYCLTIALSRNKQLLAVGYGDGLAVVYEFPEMNRIANFTHPDAVMQVGFFENDEVFLSRSVTTSFWNLNEGSKLLAYPKEVLLSGTNTQDDIWRRNSGQFAISPDGRDIAISLFDHIQLIRGQR